MFPLPFLSDEVSRLDGAGRVPPPSVAVPSKGLFPPSGCSVHVPLLLGRRNPARRAATKRRRPRQSPRPLPSLPL